MSPATALDHVPLSDLIPEDPGHPDQASAAAYDERERLRASSVDSSRSSTLDHRAGHSVGSESPTSAPRSNLIRKPFGPPGHPHGEVGLAVAEPRSADGSRTAPKTSVHSEMARRYYYIAAFDISLRGSPHGSPASAIALVAQTRNDESPPKVETVRIWWTRWQSSGRRFDSLVPRCRVVRTPLHPMVYDAVDRWNSDLLRRLPATVVARKIHAEVVRAGEHSVLAIPSVTTVLKLVQKRKASLWEAPPGLSDRIVTDHADELRSVPFHVTAKTLDPQPRQRSMRSREEHPTGSPALKIVDRRR